MLKLIEANEKYLDQYKEAYIEALKQLQLGNISKHDFMFLNPDENLNSPRKSSEKYFSIKEGNLANYSTKDINKNVGKAI